MAAAAPARAPSPRAERARRPTPPPLSVAFWAGSCRRARKRGEGGARGRRSGGKAGSPDPCVSRGTPDAVHSGPPSPRGGPEALLWGREEEDRLLQPLPSQRPHMNAGPGPGGGGLPGGCARWGVTEAPPPLRLPPPFDAIPARQLGVAESRKSGVFPEEGEQRECGAPGGEGGAEFTASGVPREAFQPGDLAFPQISAPRARPLFSPSGNTPAENQPAVIQRWTQWHPWAPRTPRGPRRFRRLRGGGPRR